MAVKSQYEGRTLITTSRTITGNPDVDANTIIKILDETSSAHNSNALETETLFKIYFNDPCYWQKIKEQRQDINNKITVSDAWSVSRTINFYCFGEPIKYVSRTTDENSDKQSKVELLSEFLDFQHNHDSTTMATLSASVCGLGYKLALPANREEFDFSGVPFVINSNFIDPRKAYCVYDTSIMHNKVLGVMIGDEFDAENNKIGKQYTVWTKYHQFIFVEGKDGLEVKRKENGDIADRMFINRIPLVEVERNAFRKGDWEICKDLFVLKNKLLSNRADDVQQVVDYILVMLNCDFENEEDKTNAIKNRLFVLETKDPQNKPSIEILKNALDQNGIQTYADYIDGLIESTAGIPSRAERGGGGHDTGQAVIYRNGYRDLENNAGMIIPKMDKAETEFLGICIGYSHNMAGGNDRLAGLQPYDVRNKFVRSLSDDPITASTSYSTFKRAGMNDLDALIASRAVTDPAEVHKNNLANTAETPVNNNSETTEDDPNNTSVPAEG